MKTKARPKSNPRGVVNFSAGDKLLAEIDRQAELERRKRGQMVIILVEEALAARSAK